MKKIFVTLFAVATVFTTVSAQVERKTEDRKDGQEKTKGEGRHDRGDKMRNHNEAFKQLNLTADQQTRIKSINEEFKTKMKNLQKNDGITVKDARAQRESLMKEHKSQIEALLTSEQKAKLEQLKTEGKGKDDAKEGGRGGHDGKGHAPDFDKLKTELNLTDDQLTKIKIKEAQVKESMKAIHQDQTLSDDQKKEKMMQLRKESKETIDALLTPEQQKKMQDLRAAHKGNKKQA